MIGCALCYIVSHEVGDSILSSILLLIVHGVIQRRGWGSNGIPYHRGEQCTSTEDAQHASTVTPYSLSVILWLASTSFWRVLGRDTYSMLVLVWATLLLLHATSLYITASSSILLVAGCTTLAMDGIWMSYEGSTTSTIIPILLPTDTEVSFGCMWCRVWIHLLVLVATTMHGVCLYVYTYMQQETLHH